MCKVRLAIDINEPGSTILIYNKVKRKDLKTHIVLVICWLRHLIVMEHIRLDAEKSLDDDIVNHGPEISGVEATFLQRLEAIIKRSQVVRRGLWVCKGGKATSEGSVCSVMDIFAVEVA
jgi:hypothetical protein